MIKEYKPSIKEQSNSVGDDQGESTKEIDSTNTIGDVFQAIKRAILTIKEIDNDPTSSPFFKTIVVDTGQFERLLSNVNTEYETEFPACFVRFTNVHFLVAQQRIGEGRATLRIRFILNRLDNQHVDWETYPFYIAEIVNKAIQNAKDKEPALQERCNLQYFDMPQSTNMLQAYWLDYEIYFKITSSYKYNDWIKKKVIIPPFTNHNDIPDGKENVIIPTYNESSIIDDGIVAASNIKVIPEDMRVQVGEQLVLKVNIEPETCTDKSVAYSSSTPSIALISSSGIITGLNMGSCDITITAANGISIKKKVIVYFKP